MQPCRRRVKEDCQKCPFLDYHKLVSYEKERSERHNRYFTLIGLSSIDCPSEDLIDHLQNQLRTSDYVFLIQDSNKSQQVQSKIGVLLPETDHEGAAIVRNRLNYLYSIGKTDIQMGLAVYPDDGTIPEKLLERAFNPEGQAEISQQMS